TALDPHRGGARLDGRRRGTTWTHDSATSCSFLLLSFALGCAAFGGVAPELPTFASAMSSERELERFAGCADARIDGVEVERERIGDLRGGELLELGQNEHFALLVVELVEDGVQDAHGLAIERELIGCFMAGRDEITGFVE